MADLSVRHSHERKSPQNREGMSSPNVVIGDSQALITDHIDIWTSAIKTKSSAGRGSSKKLDLYGIKKLRELILELAVRGKLVPQDPNDEPASELLKRIEAAKSKLVKEGQIKKQKPLPPITDADKPFNLPDGWSYTRLDDLCATVCSGSTPPKSELNETSGIPFLKVYNIQNQEIEFEKRKLFVTKDSHQGKLKRSILYPGDVLLNLVGPPLGKVAIIPNTFSEWNCNQNIVCFRPLEIELNNYIYTYLKAHIFLNYIALVGSAGQDFISGTKCRAIVLPTPPLEEQQRIVAKVDELMALCDQLETQTEASIDAHKTLVEVLLATLTNAKDADELNNSWQHLSQHFDVLFTTQASIDQLKQTILQLAVMGKLVKQDPSDEPAAKLLERISTEKAQLIKDGKIKKQKTLPPFTKDEIPFDLPSGWEWVQLQNITSKITDGDHQTPPRLGSGFLLYSAKNVRDGYLDTENCDYISESHYIKSRERCLPEAGDLLIVSVGGTIGRSSLVPYDSNFALVRSVALIKPLLFQSKFLKYAADAPLLQDSIHNNKRGGAQPCLYLSEISKFPFPMPPLEEQVRIVATIDQLIALCDFLKANLKDAQTTQLQLTDAIVEQAL